ncbi:MULTISPECIES: helix-turn-helix domain-containing protein [unclassified Achromobacter]|uniref:helix-turn-helix domain-containing protein n=1 Tax=unclassified Achromobacter TaxID=2626865 RepID=UPI0006C5DE0E|nr:MULTISPECIES: helix-turn-helix domain-containing protein [unclassified Achromobacter]KOF54072.1 DNA-binding protein [Achromobacter sp. DMS1]
MRTFSDRLKHARLLRGYTQKDLARLSRLSQSAIGSYESGLRQSSRSLRKLAHVLKVEVEWLETGKGPMEPPLESYDLSNTLPPVIVADSANRTSRRPRPQAPWPFPNISPSRFDALSPAERLLLEELNKTFLDTVQAQRTPRPRGRKSG